MPKNFLIAMSGGTTPVINATLTGVIRQTRKSFPEAKIYAGYPGILGILADRLVELTQLDESALNRIYRTPASGLIGATRVELINQEQIQRFADIAQKYDIGYFLNIGGNGTIKQSRTIQAALGDDISVCALPKTVDNDLGDEAFHDVYYTPGFPSCAKYWRHKTHVLNYENLGAFSHDQTLIAQTFGRETGFLAGCARLADPDRRLPLLILLPEDQRGVEDVQAAVEDCLQKHNRCLIVMSEGYEIGNFETRFDPSGQVMYGSSGNTQAQLLVNYLMGKGIGARAFVPGFDQRSEMKSVSTIDIESAYGVGAFAIRSLLQGQRNFFSSIRRLENALNQIGFHNIPLPDIQGFSRDMPERWITHGQFDVTDEYVSYVSPLIGYGDLPTPTANYELYYSEPSALLGIDPADAH